MDRFGRPRAQDADAVEPAEASTQLSGRVQEFIRVRAVEETQALARRLLREGGSIDDRKELVASTYDSVTGLLANLYPDRRSDILELSQAVEALFGIDYDAEDPTGGNEVLEDIYCSDIGGVKFRNQDLGSDIHFIHHLLSTVQRIGKFGTSTETDAPKNSDAYEGFLVKDPSELIAFLQDEKREFFHHL